MRINQPLISKLSTVSFDVPSPQNGSNNVSTFCIQPDQLILGESINDKGIVVASFNAVVYLNVPFFEGFTGFFDFMADATLCRRENYPARVGAAQGGGGGVLADIIANRLNWINNCLTKKQEI